MKLNFFFFSNFKLKFFFHFDTQVSAGQHMHLNGDLKNNVSVAAQQGIFFNQQHTNKAQPPNMNAGPGGCNNNGNNPNNSQSSHAPQPNNNSQSMCTTNSIN